MIELRGNPEVFFSDSPSIALGLDQVEQLKEQALKNPRRRCRLCIHQDETDPIHQMVIVHMNDTYVRPHKHRTRTESFHMIEGKCSLVLFDEEGGIRDIVHLGLPGSGQSYFFKTTERLFHTTLIHTDIAVFLETTEGPFLRDDTLFPPWAPNGEDDTEVSKYLEDLHAIVSQRDPYPA